MQRAVHDRAIGGSFDRARRPAALPHRRAHGRHRSAPDQEALLALQQLAGNAAVARSLVGQRRNGRVIAGVDLIKLKEHPSPAPDGLKSIRALKNGAGIMGYTTREISDNPPILKPESPSQSKDGWTVKARSVNHIGEPKFETYWPLKGLHKLDESNAMDIDDTWEKKLKAGEDEHVKDTTLAWEKTWKLVADVINKLAQTPGPARASADDARKDLFARFRKALPSDDLKPEGVEPDESAQRKVLGVDDGTLFWWMFQTTVVRDTREYHQPDTTHTFQGNQTIGQLAKGKSEIPGKGSDELLEEVRKKFKPGKIIQGTQPIKK